MKLVFIAILLALASPAWACEDSETVRISCPWAESAPISNAVWKRCTRRAKWLEEWGAPGDSYHEKWCNCLRQDRGQ